MEGLQNRIDSFTKSKRVKNPTKASSTVKVKWPHPAQYKATPESLAEAGFYFNPSYEDRDNVTCYYCAKQLSDWEEEDDPFLIHYEKMGTHCCWAVLRCGLKGDVDQRGRFIFPDKTRLPSSNAMEKARLDSFNFGGGWIHDRTKNHGANSKKMALAGFVFTPQQPGDDLASCLYCDVSLSGWEPDDDPLEEHRKRDKKSGTLCPFFSAPSDPQRGKPSSKSQSNKPPSKSQIKPASRSQSKSKQHDILIPTKTYDGESDTEAGASTVESGAPNLNTAKTPKRARSVKKGAKTPRNKTRSTSRSGLKNVVEDEEGSSPIIVVKTARSRSKSAARATTPELSDEDGQERARKMSRTVAGKQKITEEEEVEKEVKGRARKTTRAVSKKIKVVEEVEQEQEEEERALKPSRINDSKVKMVEIDDGEEEVLRKSARNKSRALIAPAQKEDAPPKPSKTRKQRVIESDLEEDVAQEKIEPPKTKGKAKPASRAVSKSKMKVASTRQEESESEALALEIPNENHAEVSSASKDAEDIRRESPKAPVTREPESPIPDVVSHQIKPRKKITVEIVSPPQPNSGQSPPSKNMHEPENETPCVRLVQDPPTTPRTVAPITPIQSLPEVPTAPENAFMPSLSKIPFKPLQNLTDAELDMTVEEWIRYQMDVEYDQFKRDGERELQRFRLRAEEVQKVIEAL